MKEHWEAGWKAGSTVQSKRGKYRAEILHDGKVAAVGSINRAYETEQEAIKDAEDILNARAKENFERGYAKGHSDGMNGKVGEMVKSNGQAKNEGYEKGLFVGFIVTALIAVGLYFILRSSGNI